MKKLSRSIAIGGLIAAALAAGIVVGRSMNGRSGGRDVPAPPQVNTMQIGLWKTKQNAPATFIPQSRFTTREKIALQTDWSSGNNQTLAMPVRLLDDSGSDLGLEPEKAVYLAGEKDFCCWRISEPGEYSLQVFKPNGTVTVIPVSVRRDPLDKE